jgi:hypothetical protein
MRGVQQVHQQGSDVLSRHLHVLLSARHLLGLLHHEAVRRPEHGIRYVVVSLPRGPWNGRLRQCLQSKSIRPEARARLLCQDSVQDRQGPSSGPRGVSRGLQLDVVSRQLPCARRIDASARHELPGVRAGKFFVGIHQHASQVHDAGSFPAVCSILPLPAQYGEDPHP